MSEGAQPQSISLTAVWTSTAAMLRANAGLLTAIAGVFMFLPPLLVLRSIPEAPQLNDDPSQAASNLQALIDYYTVLAPWLFGQALLQAIGTAAIYRLLLARDGVTVGRALVRGITVLPFFVILTLIWNWGVGIGFLFFFVPGLYLLGRTIIAFPMLVVETPTAPISSLGRAWQETGSQAWAIGIMVILMWITVALIGYAVLFSVGSIVLLLGGPDVGDLLRDALAAFIGATGSVVMAALTAALYRAVTGR